MTTQPDATLDALDWHTYTCQCTHGCRATATHVVHIHAVGRCDDLGLSPDGNRVELRCHTCTRLLAADVSRKLARLTRYGLPVCDTCGAPLAAVGDVIREVTDL